MITDAELQWLADKYSDKSGLKSALTDLQDFRKTVVGILDGLGPLAVRVREGGGPEDHKMSLAVTVAKLKRLLDTERAATKFPTSDPTRKSKMSKFNFPELSDQLKTHAECIVVFTKLDGTTRTMRCTLKAELLPESHRPIGSLLTEGDSSHERISVWDLDVGEWRGFRVDSVQSFSIV